MSVYYALGYIAEKGNREVKSARPHAQTRKQLPVQSVKLFGLLSVVAVLIAVGMLVDTVNASASQASGEGQESTMNLDNSQIVGEQIVIVQAGDSLWTIARDHKPAHMNIRTYLDQLKGINGLEGSIIHEGMLLKLPE